MRLGVLALVVGLAASAHAAPWSVELPPGYAEQPGAADDSVAALKKLDHTATADAQIYLSPDAEVQLTRISWVITRSPPTRRELEQFDDGVMAGAAEEAKQLSSKRQFVGDQLVSESINENDQMRVHHRRLYSADTRGALHVLMVICAGPADKLTECETAQQRAQLTLPDPAALPVTAPSEARDAAYLIGQIVGGVLLAALVIWLIRRRRN